MNAPAPVYTAAEIREIERAAQAATPGLSLMARAGRAAFEVARRILGERGKSVLVLAGPGNNGGDAFEVAVHLKSANHRVALVFTGTPESLPSDAATALAKWRDTGGELFVDAPRGPWDLVIDGLYGIGLSRPLAGRDAALVETVNASGSPILALDIASGIAGDTGEITGIAIRATETITFIALKPGLLTLDGPDYCGRVHCDALGLNVRALAPAGGHYGQFLVTPAREDQPAPRPRNFHKGLAGAVAIVGGARGMTGAALLAGRAALRIGAGKVFLGLADETALTVDLTQPELMLRDAHDLLASEYLDAVAIGPGLGTSVEAHALVVAALALDTPLVLDADALNLIAGEASLAAALRSRPAPSVVTPHPAEAARLLGASTRDVQSDRLRATRELARKLGATSILKGNGTITAARDGHYWINGSGNAGMAAAGMGDVLTGLIASLLAQGFDPERAARYGVWLHGAAGDACVASGRGPAGLTASEIVDAARSLINRRDDTTQHSGKKDSQ